MEFHQVRSRSWLLVKMLIDGAGVLTGGNVLASQYLCPLSSGCHKSRRYYSGVLVTAPLWLASRLAGIIGSC